MSNWHIRLTKYLLAFHLLTKMAEIFYAVKLDAKAIEVYDFTCMKARTRVSFIVYSFCCLQADGTEKDGPETNVQMFSHIQFWQYKL